MEANIITYNLVVYGIGLMCYTLCCQQYELNTNNLNKKIMNRKDFEVLMNSLFSNNQLFIPQGQTIEEWIDNAFVDEEKEAVKMAQAIIKHCL